MKAKLNLYIESDLRTKLEMHAKRNRRSLSQMVEDIIEDYDDPILKKNHTTVGEDAIQYGKSNAEIALDRLAQKMNDIADSLEQKASKSKQKNK